MNILGLCWCNVEISALNKNSVSNKLTKDAVSGNDTGDSPPLTLK